MFSRLTALPDTPYADLTKRPLPMAKSHLHRKLEAIYETVPDPNPEALLKAFALLFQRGPYAPEKRRFDKNSQSSNVQDGIDH